MKVLDDEGVAIHIDPESCAAYQRIGAPRAGPKAEVRREALTGDRAGQPLSRERINRGADAVQRSEGNMAGRDRRVLGRPRAVADPGMHGRSLRGNREIFGSAANGLTSGPHRDGLTDRSR